MQARGHAVEQQREYCVHYRGHFIGKLIPDLIVDGKVIVDPKVVTAFDETSQHFTEGNEENKDFVRFVGFC